MNANVPFSDRREAGRILGERLRRHAGRDDVVVLGLPRGGVPVGYEVARALRAPFDVFVVRKLGVPGHEELAMGAIASGGVQVLNQDVIAPLGITVNALESVLARERSELDRREREFRGDRPAPVVRDRVVILVDDGLATGSTMEAAVAALRQEGPAGIIVAAPVGAPDTCRRLRGIADDCECVMTPSPFFGVGAWYRDFTQTTDEEVRALLGTAGRRAAADLVAT